jgi:hypothetical protein
VITDLAGFSNSLINPLLLKSGDNWPTDGLAAFNDTTIATTQLIVLFENVQLTYCVRADSRSPASTLPIYLERKSEAEVHLYKILHR